MDETLSPLRPFLGCPVCGSSMVWIRGKYPNDDKRKICPTCAQERLEQITEIANPHYGLTKTELTGGQ